MHYVRWLDLLSPFTSRTAPLPFYVFVTDCYRSKTDGASCRRSHILDLSDGFLVVRVKWHTFGRNTHGCYRVLVNASLWEHRAWGCPAVGEIAFDFLLRQQELKTHFRLVTIHLWGIFWEHMNIFFSNNLPPPLAGSLSRCWWSLTWVHYYANWWFSSSLVSFTWISLHSRKLWVDDLPSLSHILLIYVKSLINERLYKD